MRPLQPPSDKRSLTRTRRRARNLERRGPSHWHYVGDPDFCEFLAGRNLEPGENPDIPDPTPLRIRWTLGAGLELQGDVTDVSPGDLICVFPAGYRPDHDTPVAGHDDNANYVGCRFYDDGRFVYGVA